YQRVAMAERPDLRGHAALAGERIVAGDAAVVVEADDLAQVGRHVLGRLELLPVAGRDPQLAGRVEGQAVAEVALAAHLRRLLPDALDAVQVAAARAVEGEPRAHHHRTVDAAAALDVAQVDAAVARVLRMQDHVAQAALSAIGHGGHAADRAGLAVGRIQ